jgi:hypothetical protein
VTITFVDDRVALARRTERDRLVQRDQRDRAWILRAFDLFGARDRKTTER